MHVPVAFLPLEQLFVFAATAVVAGIAAIVIFVAVVGLPMPVPI